MAAVNHQLPNRIFLEDKLLPAQQQQQPLVQPGPWVPDERDAFISWLRSEFAAANAIIDAMCQHLQAMGSPGEYDFVLNCVRQRRFNWNAVLHMQQYFSVEEVVLALQQVILKRRQVHATSRVSGSGEIGIWADQQAEQRAAALEKIEIQADLSKLEPEKEIIHTSGADTASNPEWQGSQSEKSSPSTQEEDHGRSSAAKAFGLAYQSQEVVDGRMINVVEGLKVWHVFNSSEADQIVSSMVDLQGIGRKVEIGGRGYKLIGGKRFLKGKTSDTLQQNSDGEDARRSSSPDETAELPGSLDAVVTRLIECQVLPPSKRPDSYIVNFLGEGGYLLPQIHNQEFEQPFCLIFLQSDCSTVFGRHITMDSPGEFRCPFKLSLSPGTVLTLQGNAAKVARYAVPALPSKRCCIVLGKMHTKRPSSRGGCGFQRPTNAGLISRPASAPNFGTMAALPGGSSPTFPPGPPAGATPPVPQPGGGPYPPMSLVVPGWSPVPRPPRLMTGTGVFLPYNAPGRPSSSTPNTRGRQGTPFLQKTNSLPASFRTQNGQVAAPAGKLAAEEGNEGENDPAASEISQIQDPAPSNSS